MCACVCVCVFVRVLAFACFVVLCLLRLLCARYLAMSSLGLIACLRDVLHYLFVSVRV